MVNLRSLYKMLPLLFLIAVAPAHAEEGVKDDLHFIGRYSFTWEGIGLAAAELSVTQDKDSYSLRLAIESKGAVNLFTHHRSDTSAHGRRLSGKYLPQAYESHYWTKKKPRHIKLAFNDKGVITEEVVEPPEDPTERPVVPHALKDGTLDPLTLLLVVRAGGDRPRVFDAKHLWDGRAERIATPQPPVIAGRKAIAYILSRKPVAGLTAKETTEYSKGEPSLAFYFTADGARVPLFMAMPVYLGRLEGRLVKECKTWDECRVW